MTHKLHPKTYRDWEEYKGQMSRDQKITFDIFLTFIKNRADLLETIELDSIASLTLGSNTSNKNTPKVKTMVTVREYGNKNNSDNKRCPKCNSEHKLSSCSQFLALTNEARLKLLPDYKICFNCFASGHYANQCKKIGCKICRRKHNTLVHITDYKPKPVTEITSLVPDEHRKNQNEPQQVQPSSLNASLSFSARFATKPRNAQGEVLLSTALLKVYDRYNNSYIARAILDSGSTSCLMSEKLYKQLGLQANNVTNSVLGINNIRSRISKMCMLTIKSLDDSFFTNIQCFVLPSITEYIPSRQVDISSFKIPSSICLADPNFHTPAPVDILIGADIFWDVLGSQMLKLGDGLPILCDTKLGWLVSGPIKGGYVSTSSQIKCNLNNIISDKTHDVYDNIQDQLSRFWQLEEVCFSSPYSPEEKLCEEYFLKGTTRLADGRFCVRIPLKHSPDMLGDSLPRAKQCLFSLERRLETKPQLCEMYKNFMFEYQSLGHMTKCHKVGMMPNAHYIPHHGVLRESSSTTKLRVVFNASSPTTSGISFNNIQMVGPVVQDDLLSILLRFRQHKYVLTADVEKMYRQISVHPDDRHLQQIIWRDKPSSPIQIYQLNTVTYGTASAPFLATRCLKQLGLECKNSKVSNAIIHDYYVDDWLSGGDELSEVIELRDNMISTLASAQMFLRKWKSNEAQLVVGLDTPQSPSLDLNIGALESSKTLGLGWLPLSDHLCFPIGESVTRRNTKRDMLSVIAQIFDPLGLLAPFVIVMKILLQKLWLHKLSWDEEVPLELSQLWDEVTINLPKLSNMRIPRRIVCNCPKELQLHIFTDASESAYGACIYVRSVSVEGEVLVRLLLAKSRVAPLKPTTIPRLELCGALIGTRLFEKAVSSLRVKITRTFFWTDSTIVLGWLRMLPSKLQPFVRNRVAAILEKTSNSCWNHVRTADNPADYITRGVDLNSISTLDIWWSGPTFLAKDMSGWPSSSSHSLINHDILPELKPNVILHGIVHKNNVNNQGIINFNRFSNFLRLIRAITYMLRFVSGCRKQLVSGPLRSDELNNALIIIIRISQMESFPEYKALLYQKEMPKKSSLLKFNVFLDDDKIIRVGGRLQHSEFPYAKKHPIILQSTHRFTHLLFRYEHKRLLHPGPQLLLATIRERYWPIRGRCLARLCYRQCTLCCRMRGRTVVPIMGNLPQQRLLAGFPFEHVGLDYAGPMLSASRQGRGCKIVKVYIAIFVCFTTKSIHLELVGDLTSNTFLLALRRFISRRGKPINIYSDNGTSFVGAYNDISKFLKTNCDLLSEEMANEGINFHFIPAYSPHFAGLAEAGVKSTKHHLVRVLGNCHLTYEEFNTTLTQIEAILNSRPLTQLSSNPDDLMPLTPGHFLVGRPLTSLPVPDYQNHSTNALTRFHRIEQLRQHFWARWSKEYVSELQLRSKWRTSKGVLKLNALVLLKEDNLPPLKWKLGRISAIYPGTDGVTRVADVRTTTGLLRRCFSKICPLPEYEELC